MQNQTGPVPVRYWSGPVNMDFASAAWHHAPMEQEGQNTWKFLRPETWKKKRRKKKKRSETEKIWFESVKKSTWKFLRPETWKKKEAKKKRRSETEKIWFEPVKKYTWMKKIYIWIFKYFFWEYIVLFFKFKRKNKVHFFIFQLQLYFNIWHETHSRIGPKIGESFTHLKVWEMRSEKK